MICTLYFIEEQNPETLEWEHICTCLAYAAAQTALAKMKGVNDWPTRIQKENVL